MIKKGFTLLECVLTMFVMASMLVLSLGMYKPLNTDSIYLANDYLRLQAESLTKKKENTIQEDGYYIHINKMGRVNKAQTINLSNKNIIIHLGNGYLTYE